VSEKIENLETAGVSFDKAMIGNKRADKLAEAARTTPVPLQLSFLPKVSFVATKDNRKVYNLVN
jgi:hypothetical protein